MRLSFIFYFLHVLLIRIIMSRQLMYSDKETGDLVQDLERSYRERISNIDQKSKQELYNYEAIDESLRRQISSLREEIDMRNIKNAKILQSKKTQLEQNLDSSKAEKDRDLNEYTRKLANSKEKFFANKQDYEKNKKSLHREKTEAENENSKLRSIISELTREIEILQGKVREVYNKDIHYAKQEVEGLLVTYESSAKKTHQDHQYESRELEFRLENCERAIENLSYDIESLKQEEESVKRQTDRDISYLRESLLESNKDIEICEGQTVQLLRNRDDAKEDSLMLTKITGELESELGKEMKINTKLSAKLAKLERLVYGKGAKSPSRSRL